MGIKMSVVSLNLALSNRCTANCTYCPEERGERDSNHMSIDVIKCVVNQVKNDAYFSSIKKIQVGENGDALLNPDFISILKILKRELPAIKINLTTNMSLLGRGLSEYILKEQLIDSLQLNIDGHDAITYEAQKHISYYNVMRNLHDYIDLRKTICPQFPIGINVLTLSDYCETINKRFGQQPIKAPEIVPTSSFEQVRESLSWLPASVPIRKSPIFAWAERGLDKVVDLSRYQCPQLPRIETEIFISPSGLWYPCCLDSNQDQAYGNILEQSLYALYHSPKRLLLLERLRNKQFSEIGYPCIRVPFCVCGVVS